jgi:flagellar biosynthetic protein FliO
MLSPALAVVFVLALLFGLLWLARHKGLAALSFCWSGKRAGRSTRQMRVVERLPLSGQHSLHLVSCSGRLLVVAVSPSGCQTLADYAELASSDALSAVGGSR